MSAIGLVTQESFLFNGTVRDNLRLGNPDASPTRNFLSSLRRRECAGFHRTDA